MVLADPASHCTPRGRGNSEWHLFGWKSDYDVPWASRLGGWASLSDVMTDMNSNDRSYSFVASVRNKASVCANARGSNYVPFACVKPTRSYMDLAILRMRLVCLSTIWPPQRTVLSWPMFTLLGNGKAQRLRSRGLAKGECRRRRKVKTRTALQPRVPRRMRAVRCR